jgi:hypothetical protein
MLAPKSRDRLALAGLALLVIFLLRGALFDGGVIYKRDVHLVWTPQVEDFVRGVLSGALPLWDPCPSFGQPLLADTSAQVLYPLTWLNLLMRPWVYYTIFSALHALLAASGSYRLARYLGASSAAAFLAGALFVLSGPFLSLVDLWHHYASAAWIPWVLLAARRAFDSPSPRGVAVFAGAVALQILAGSADMCAMTLLIAAADLLSRADWHRPLSAGNRRLAATGLAAVALGVGVSAVLWTSTLELALRTPRQSLPEAIRMYWSVHPATTLELLYPGLWSRLSLAPALRAALFESREPFLASLYLGVPVLALVVGGLVLRPSREGRFWLAVFVASLLVSLGRNAVFYQLAVLLVPPLRILRYPVKAMVIVAFAATLLAGLGWDAWRGDGAPASRRIRLGLLLPLGLVVAVGLSGAMLLYWDASSWAPRILASVPAGASARALLAPARGPLLSATLLAALCAAIALGRARATRPGPWAAALAVLALGDLALYHRNAIPLAPPALYTHRPPLVDGLRELHAGRIYVYDYTQAEQNRRWLGREVGHLLSTVPAGFGLDPALALSMQQTLAPATAGRWDLRSGFEIDYRGLQPDYLGLLTTAIRQLGPDAQLRLLRVGAVTHVVALHSAGFERLAPGPAWDTLLADRVRVFGVPEPLARARVVAGARVGDGVAGLATMLDPGFDPAREVLLPEGAPAQPSSALPVSAAVPASSTPGSVRIAEERADRIVLEAELRAPGYVVLADAFDPGWRATLDGSIVPLLRANLGFRAVSAPAGRHRVEMAYRPRALWLGLAVSATALLTALILVLRPRR